MADGLTREEFVKQYGFDPTADAPAPAPQKQNSLLHFGRSVATGIATIPTDFAALPQTAYAGVRAAYDTLGTDKPFLDEFVRQMRVEGADERIQQHIGSLQEGWRKDQPGIDEAGLRSLLQQYQNTKEFEDFTTSLLVGGPRFAEQWKDSVREFLGDHRTNKQQSWTDTAGEVIGGSLIGGPAGWAARAGKAAAGNAVANAIVNNPVSRGALRTAEVLTPLTMPYTPGNIALNAGVGVAFDQGLRAAQGRSTMFSDDDAGIPALAGVAGAVGAAAAFVGAVRARGVKHLQQTQIKQVVQNDPRLDATVRPANEGQTAIADPNVRMETPTSYVDTLNPMEQVRLRSLNRSVDESLLGSNVLEDARGKELAAEFDALFGTHTGAAMNDAVRATTSAELRPVHDALMAIPDDVRSQVMAAMLAPSVMSLYRQVWHATQKEINDLAKVKNPTPAQTTALAELRSDLARLRSDDPSARIITPSIGWRSYLKLEDAFKNAVEPEIIRVREALKTWAEQQLQKRVDAGMMTKKEMADLHAKNPYYVPLGDDPYKGAVGIRRAFNAVVQGLKNVVDTSGRSLLHESPIRTLPLKIPRTPQDQQGLIHQLLNPMTTMKMYTEQNARNIAHTKMRNFFINGIARDANGKWSRMITDKFVERLRLDSGKVFFTNKELENPLYAKLLRDPHLVPLWDKGTVSFYKFGDPEITAMLRQDPVLMTGIVRAMALGSHVFKMNTTGVLAPVFALVNAYMDTAVGIATRAPNRAFGQLSYAAKRVLPEGIAKQVEGRIPDPTPIVTVPLQAVRGMIDVVVHGIARKLASDLAQQGPFAAIAQRMGVRGYQAAVTKMLQVAQNSHTMHLINQGVAYNSALDEVAGVRGVLDAIRDSVPPLLQRTYSFYSDLVSSVHLAPKRMFYTQNYALLERKYGKGNIPQIEIDKLVHEARSLAGNMTRRPASPLMKNLDAVFPYLSPIRSGNYHLMRNMSEPGKAGYIIPRLALMMMGLGTSMYMMTYWDDEARRAYWNMPTWERLRTLKIPTFDTLTRWSQGENVPYRPDAVYDIRIAPDLAPVIAGTAAFMQSVGVLPADATPKPLYRDIPKVLADSVTPAMPPMLQALLAQSGFRMDPQGADTRGGAWIRQLGGFRKGPDAESASNLGEVSNSTALMMSALFGANGAAMATFGDAFLHATKFEKGIGSNGELTRRSDAQYMEGLKAATGITLSQMVQRAPDIPLVWQTPDKLYAGTPTWEATTEAKTHIASIGGIRDAAKGKAAARARQLAAQAGGIPPQVMTDVALADIAQDIYTWDRTGDLGKIKKQYTDLVRQKRAVDVNYNLPAKERQEKSNAIARQMQDNQQNQYYAIMAKEQMIAETYGAVLQPRLQGRELTMQTLDRIMREAIGTNRAVAVSAE